MTKKEQQPIFKKSILSCLLIIGFGIYLSIRGTKEKTEFNNVTGQIDYFDKTFQEINYRNKGDHRFIHIVDFPLIFDVFVGQASGDFGPKFEQLDKLKLGDEITVFYDDKTPLQKSHDIRFNKTVQFIDKDGEAYFIRGNKDKYGGYLAIGVGILLTITLLILKKIEKIK
ncbi:hypothetical protein [Seonamhaeicola aphaedonensis]|uniref:Uncharacterized protein n=1 Tax=Seonamhaeicola aphaedonensis TaxID=1461338 RepID=A0A3D9H3S5_9FLAO|nr:hypothetical protein [Seonamhaeicola aphaedonensis]RED44154.1 hypothetical protein DFQ02_1224 [Seonamhaeicola aphaedonensis]